MKKNISLESEGKIFDLKNLPLIFILAILTILAFLPAFSAEFTNWDDPSYVTENPAIRKLDFKSMKHHFSDFYMGNYHPLTMISLSIDYSFSKLDPSFYHTHNILLHAGNTILVFLIFLLVLGRKEYAFIGAALFGVHTIHVESVTWVSERKDVLYTFYFLASFYFYLIYLKKSDFKYYLIAFGLFVLSLFSKGQAVSLAVSIIAADYFFDRKIFSWKVIFEKVPFLIAAIIFGLVAIKAQTLGPNPVSADGFNFLHRILFASYGFMQYLGKLLFPYSLSAFYPYPHKDQPLPVIFYIAPFIGLAIAAAVFYSKKYSKYFLFGFLFFILNIAQVLQLLPVGKAIMADRYAYIPSIGFFFILSATGMLLEKKNASLKNLIYLFAGCYILLLTVLSFRHNEVWHDSLSLWNDVIEKYPNAGPAYNNRGVVYEENDEKEKALADYNKALEIDPSHAEAYNNRAIVLAEMQKYDEALSDYGNAIKFKKQYADAYYNRGNAYAAMKKYELALADYNKVVEIKPNHYGVYNNRGLVLKELGRYQAALEDLNKVVKLNPKNAEGYSNRSIVRYLLKDYQGAEQDNIMALKLNPGKSESWFNQGNSKMAAGKFDEAIGDFTKMIEQKPEMYEAWFNRGVAKYYTNRLNDAIEDYNQAIKIKPDYLPAILNRGICRGNLGDLKGAAEDYKQTLLLDPKQQDALVNLGILDYSANRFREALSYFNKAVEAKPDYAEAYLNRGLAYAALKDFRSAIADYDRAIKLKPDAAIAYNNRGVAKYQNGDKHGACDDWKVSASKGFANSEKFIQTYCK